MAEAGDAREDSATDDAPGRSWNPSTVITLATGFLALVGVIAYAIMRYSYQAYYNVFGLTPDDVGPNSAAALTQSGAGAATFVLLFAVLPVALAVLGSLAVDRLVGRWLWGRAGKRELAALVAALALPTVAALGIYRAFTALTNGHREAKQLVALGVGIVLLLARRHALRLPWTRRLPRMPWILAATTAAVGALVLGGSLPQDAKLTARCAIDRHEPVRFVHTHRTLPLLDHISVLRVRADPAVIRWIVPSRVALPTPPLVYLGDSGGRYFVFSVSRRRTLEVPDADVVLATIPRGHCHYWQRG